MGENAGGYVYKTKKCWWHQTGYCHNGVNCKFSHGTEELRILILPRDEGKVCRHYSSKGYCHFGSRCIYDHPVKTYAATEAATPIPQTDSTVKAALIREIPAMPTTSLSGRDWSPCDDGVEITTLPNSTSKPASREDVDRHIDKVLYNSTSTRRLPVFRVICPG